MSDKDQKAGRVAEPPEGLVSTTKTTKGRKFPGTPGNEVRAGGWVYYDADCALCAGSAKWAAVFLGRRGFVLVPLQTPGAEELVGVPPVELLARMHLLTREGRRFAGADAFVEIARHVGWARPLAFVAGSPLVLPRLRRIYDWIAANRYCFGGTCPVPRRSSMLDWLPLLILPAIVLVLRDFVADWAFMWAMAFALFAGCKWLTYRKAVANGARLSVNRTLGYLFGWVGMKADVFADTRPARTGPTSEWIRAMGRIFAGVALLWGAARMFQSATPLPAGWLAMFGIVMLLHFGTFQLLALAWQRAGVPVEPLMRAPLRATSLGDFWGSRWNTGFHVLAHEFLFRPLSRLLGRIPAVLGVFLVSGLVHEIVITLPARGGYGLPTAYFLLQGTGLVLERSALGRRLGLGPGLRGRVFAIVVAAVPVFWLFPPAFVRNVILPMLEAIGAL